MRGDIVQFPGHGCAFVGYRGLNLSFQLAGAGADLFFLCHRQIVAAFEPHAEHERQSHDPYTLKDSTPERFPGQESTGSHQENST